MPEATVDRLGVVDSLLTVDDIASLVTTLVAPLAQTPRIRQRATGSPVKSCPSVDIRAWASAPRTMIRWHRRVARPEPSIR